MSYFYIIILASVVPLLGLIFIKSTETKKLLGLSIIVISVIALLIAQTSKNSLYHDTETWNGKIVSKSRVHDDYVRSYDCNCRSVSCGKDCSTTVCDTCYEDHYTVTWSAKSTIGSILFKHLDTLSRSVYNTPDPSAYANCRIGEPASLTKSYYNYVKAAPESLFNTKLSQVDYFIPPYPTTHSFYKINRVVGINTKVDVVELNDLISNELITLGASKQVNVIVILSNYDSNFRYAVENTWLGAKKNDVVVFLGLDGDSIIWSDVMTWALNSGNERFRVTLSDNLLRLNVFNPKLISDSISKNIKALYDRPEMKSFEYIKDSVSLPFWCYPFTLLLSIVSTILIIRGTGRGNGNIKNRRTRR